ncbi:hypothetical protein ElyMa_003165700 [Elysia marginata]|uniref:Uncharacterized protein n=1 Tax=Elysia marginata TaxID=1093978 RepID=A0AAV4IWQ7_9GAST|nr:hypothetical protein ElyMa_003165700 [Elysia marginata]
MTCAVWHNDFTSQHTQHQVDRNVKRRGNPRQPQATPDNSRQPEGSARGSRDSPPVTVDFTVFDKTPITLDGTGMKEVDSEATHLGQPASQPASNGSSCETSVQRRCSSVTGESRGEPAVILAWALAQVPCHVKTGEDS